MNFENLIMVPTWVLVHPRPKLAPYILMRTWVYAESLETYMYIYIYTHTFVMCRKEAKNWLIVVL
jgi:hypothetical protein